MSRQAASIQKRFENPKCGQRQTFCLDPVSAFDEVLAVPVVVPEQTKMTSKSTTLKSGSTPYGMNRSKGLALKSTRKGDIQILGS